MWLTFLETEESDSELDNVISIPIAVGFSIPSPIKTLLPFLLYVMQRVIEKKKKKKKKQFGITEFVNNFLRARSFAP